MRIHEGEPQGKDGGPDLKYPPWMELLLGGIGREQLQGDSQHTNVLWFIWTLVYVWLVPVGKDRCGEKSGVGGGCTQQEVWVEKHSVSCHPGDIRQSAPRGGKGRPSGEKKIDHYHLSCEWGQPWEEGRLPERMNQRSALVIQKRQGWKCGAWEQFFPSLGHHWDIRKLGPTCWIGACLSLERWHQHWCSRSLESAPAKLRDDAFFRRTRAVTSAAFLEIWKISIL